MSILAKIVKAVEAYDRFVDREVRRARTDRRFAASLQRRWTSIRAKIATTTTPTGLSLPRLALPATDVPEDIARFLLEQGLPGEFPYVNSAYAEMYLDRGDSQSAEEPTRLFAGLGLAADTNRRFHYLTQHQRTIRLSTAFDGPTLYGLDSDADGALGKIGEGGVAIDTLDDMADLFAGFDLADPHVSVSMTINGPAPILLAMFVAAAKRRFGTSVVNKLRGTIQADVFKEVQAQNEMILPIDPALKLLGDMVEFTTANMPRWYPISISGYHIAEAGATPVQQAAYTLSNGFAYVEMFKARGLDVNRFGPRLSFFLDCGLDVEYLALTRVARKIWAIGMRDGFAAGESAQRFKVHTQTSGRSLVAANFQNNLTRTAIELMLAYINATNSCHSNSADEPFTTPAEQYVRLAANAQAIVLEESGLFKHTMNLLAGSPGMLALERELERSILEEFRTIDALGGVRAAIEHRYQRSRIQEAALRYEQQIHSRQRTIVGLNRYADASDVPPQTSLVRTPRARKLAQIARLGRFKQRHASKAAKSLDALSRAIESNGNVFEELIRTVEHCSLGQITERLTRHWGRFRPMV